MLNRSKTLHFREAVDKLSTDPQGLWKMAKWGKERSTKPKDLPKFPSLRRGDTMVESFDQKIGCLRQAFLPPPPQADLADIQGTEYPCPLDMDTELTEEEVRRAVWKPRQDKAPGVNGIPNRQLRVVYTGLREQIRCLFQACIKLGYHPRPFKEANTIILKKPQKTDYADPKSYRPIALLDTREGPGGGDL